MKFIGALQFLFFDGPVTVFKNFVFNKLTEFALRTFLFLLNAKLGDWLGIDIVRRERATTRTRTTQRQIEEPNNYTELLQLRVKYFLFGVYLTLLARGSSEFCEYMAKVPLLLKKIPVSTSFLSQIIILCYIILPYKKILFQVVGIVSLYAFLLSLEKFSYPNICNEENSRSALWSLDHIGRDIRKIEGNTDKWYFRTGRILQTLEDGLSDLKQSSTNNNLEFLTEIKKSLRDEMQTASMKLQSLDYELQELKQNCINNNNEKLLTEIRKTMHGCEDNCTKQLIKIDGQFKCVRRWKLSEYKDEGVCYCNVGKRHFQRKCTWYELTPDGSCEEKVSQHDSSSCEWAVLMKEEKCSTRCKQPGSNVLFIDTKSINAFITMARSFGVYEVPTNKGEICGVYFIDHYLPYEDYDWNYKMKLFCNACINGINGRSLHENAGEGEITTLEFWVSIKASIGIVVNNDYGNLKSYNRINSKIVPWSIFEYPLNDKHPQCILVSAFRQKLWFECIQEPAKSH